MQFKCDNGDISLKVKSKKYLNANDILQIGDRIVITGKVDSSNAKYQRELLKQCNGGNDFIGEIIKKYGSHKFDLKVYPKGDIWKKTSLSKWVHETYQNVLLPWCAQNYQNLWSEGTGHDGWLYTSVIDKNGNEKNLAKLTSRIVDTKNNQENNYNEIISLPNDSVVHPMINIGSNKNCENEIDSTSSGTYKRTPLSDKKRDILCDYWFHNYNTVDCFLCQKISISRSIRQGNFVAAHIVPHTHGGSDENLWNFIPCCNGCNAKTGTFQPINLLDFVEENYVSRLYAVCSKLFEIYQKEQPIGISKHFENILVFIKEIYSKKCIGEGGYCNKNIKEHLQKYINDKSSVLNKLKNNKRNLDEIEDEKNQLEQKEERLKKKRRILLEQNEQLTQQSVLVFCNCYK